MLVITGTQRSGTSMIAACMMEMGYDLDGSDWDEQAKGGYENVPVCNFYRNHLGDRRFPYDDFPWPTWTCHNEEEFIDLTRRVIKFSYLLMNPAFVTIWDSYRHGRGDKFLVMNRSKWDVVNSKHRAKRRFEHDSPLLKQTVQGLIGNYEASLGLLDEFGYQYVELDFPKCVSNLSQVNLALGTLDRGLRIPQEVWNSVVKPEWVHFK